jgi:hypothetical protein
VPRVTPAYRLALRDSGYPWNPQPHMTARLGEREVPLFPATVEELRIVQKYGRWFEPRSFALMLSRLTTARRREALAFLAAGLCRAVTALRLAAFTSDRPARHARPLWLAPLVPTFLDRAPPAGGVFERGGEVTASD